MTGSGLSWQDGGMRPTAYRRNARGPRDRQAFEHIRMQAGARFAAGHSQAQVARQLGVARQVVSRWHARWRQGGLEALRGGRTWHPADPRHPPPGLLVPAALRPVAVVSLPLRRAPLARLQQASAAAPQQRRWVRPEPPRGRTPSRATERSSAAGPGRRLSNRLSGDGRDDRLTDQVAGIL